MSDLGPIERAVELAEQIAATWRPIADASTTLGCERALLRLAGVTGLDRDGRPLAWSIVERYLAGHPERLAGGILLPFAMAAVEYDLGPQELALDAASGAVDLGLDLELLGEPDRRAVAEAEAARFAEAAIARVDANRTARRELLDVLGEADRPWVGATSAESFVEDASREAWTLVRAGTDVVRVPVPAGRELADREAAASATSQRAIEGRGRAGAALALVDDEGEPDVAPAGSQRGLARLRETLDEAAAERQAYVRLATVAPPLGAPEQAAVAALERVDLVESDALEEIVTGGVDPDRVLADHAFAHRLDHRAGTTLLIGAGPLVVGPDFRRGVPASSATLSGRALAMQLLGVAFAMASGLPAAQIAVGALPAWIAEDRDAGPHALAAASLRRICFAGHPVAFAEPELAGQAAARWPFLVAAALQVAGPALVVFRSGAASSAVRRSTEVRAAADVASWLAWPNESRALAGPAVDHARAQAEAAVEALERLRDDGWASVLGAAPGEVRRLDTEGAVERTESFDAFAGFEGAVGRPSADVRR